jgi:uncharacterized protein (TIGR03083 family)
VDHQALIEALRREGTTLGDIRIVDVDVPTCPGWTLADLVHHVGTVHRWQEAQLRADDTERLARSERLERPDDESLQEWLQHGLASLLQAFAETDPERLTPTWFGPRPASFWARRAAHETAIHRWDAQAAVMSPSPIDAAQAVDAIDELLENVVPRRVADAGWEPPPASIHLHATDIDGEWTIHVDGQSVTVTRSHDKGDVAARGSANDLILLLAGRIPPSRLELFGDHAVLDRWHRSVAI